MRDPDLAQLTGQPTAVDIAGRRLYLSEYTLDQLGQLQGWIKANVPHPLDAIRGHLDGLTPPERESLLEKARVDARSWPPAPGTQAGSEALFGNPAGMAYALVVALRTHHPEATERDARWLIRQMGKPANEALSRRIIGILFGNEDGGDDDLELSLPKAPGAATGAPSATT